ncbi:histidine--tRNA ligase [Spiroplasma endosymbiont of Nebria brevicollis]|uniref:histidine--tRNA ligase n=1 Tax=Spiroplasma endosymbiont of Nebria brevicollis TaxID=3066284 RepID=UPI00313B1970
MTIQKPRGTRDLYEQDIIVYRNIINILQTCAAKYNYQEFITPTFEDAQLFLRAVGVTTDIIQKEIYQFNDKGDRTLALRPEGTAGLVRAVIENKLYKPKQTLKYFYYGSMFRYERPQKGRQREFNQFGIETIGTNHPLSDVEVIMMAINMMEDLEISNLSLNINYFGSDETKNKYQVILKEHLISKKSQFCENCQMRTLTNPIRVLDCKTCHKLSLDIPKITEILSPIEQVNFALITETLTKHNISFKIDEYLVRGLDYYTGIIFEITSSNPRIGETQNALIGGGRYDNLLQQLGSPLAIPAIGFAIGIERLMLLLSNNKQVNRKPIMQLQIIALSDNALNMMSWLLQQLRNKNYQVDGEYHRFQDKHKSQIIDRTKAYNLLFLKDETAATIYSYDKKVMIPIQFKGNNDLLQQIINRLKEQ